MGNSQKRGLKLANNMQDTVALILIQWLKRMS